MAGRGGVSHRSQGLGAVYPNNILADLFQGAYFRQTFPGPTPHAVGLNGYADPTGATGDFNFLHFHGLAPMDAVYHIKGLGQTLLAPTVDSTNGYLLAGLDAVASEGVEYILGALQTAQNPLKCLIGTSPNKFLRVKFKAGTVANVGELAVGWRLAEAAQANLDDYNDLACLNLQAGNVKVETILNGAATVTSPAAGGITTVADGVETEFEVWIVGGKARYFINGDPVQIAPVYTFRDAINVVPTIFWLQNGSGGSTFGITEIECGSLYFVDKDPARR